METKKIEQKGLIGNSKFGKHFYALALGLAIVLSGGLYFLVSAEDLSVATNLQNAHQTIGSVTITSDGTTNGTEYFDFNFDGVGGAKFYEVPSGVIQRKLGLDGSNKLVYEDGASTDDGDRVIDGDDIYRVTGHVSIGTKDYISSGGKLNIVSSEVGFPELYISQSQNSASNIYFLNTTYGGFGNTWSLGLNPNGGDSYFYIGRPGFVNSLYIANNGSVAGFNANLSISGSLNMLNNDIDNANIVTAVAFVMSSDKDKKENIEKIKNPLDKIYQLNGYTFDRKKEWVLDGRKHDVGVLAQEVEKVLPELVHVDSNGHKGVQYANMVALLIEGIKELGNKMDSLYDKYLDQQSKIDSLEQRIELLEIRGK